MVDIIYLDKNEDVTTDLNKAVTIIITEYDENGYLVSQTIGGVS